MSNLIEELIQEIERKEKNVEKRAIKVRVNPNVFLKLVEEHNSNIVNSQLSKDNPEITIKGIPFEQTEEVENWEVVL